MHPVLARLGALREQQELTSLRNKKAQNMNTPLHIRLSLVAIAVVGFFSLGGIVTAHAHDQLVSSNPAANESLAMAPNQIVLEFSDTLLVLSDELVEAGNVVRVTNVLGEEVTTGQLSIDSRTVTQPLQPNLPNGQYRVVWSVVSADGHPINDTFQFAIGEPIGAFEPTTQTPEAISEPPEPFTEADEVQELEQEAEGFDLGRAALFGLIGGGAAAGIYALVMVRKRRASQNDTAKTKEHS